jgi:hypothetical protein
MAPAREPPIPLLWELSATNFVETHCKFGLFAGFVLANVGIGARESHVLREFFGRCYVLSLGDTLYRFRLAFFRVGLRLHFSSRELCGSPFQNKLVLGI